MPLEEYRRKRDFASTPEPSGDGGRAPAPGETDRRFVVQRHRATRLHYDLRFEMGGILASWAVPKGPTLDSGERRMAVHVEDHPLDYFDFEGVIPARQYGAGDVIVWDWGTYEPDDETPDPEAAIANGELKFRFRGEKLHGRFTLVRTDVRRRKGAVVARDPDADGSEQWLLIKKRDADAIAGWDAADHPRSVKTGRTNDEVKANRDALWLSDAPAARAEIDLAAAREAPLPDFVPPMAATLAAKPFSDDDWLFEVKWDGYRVEAVVRDGAVRTFTRNGNDAATYFPRLLEPPTWIDAREAIVDGEVVALAPDGTPSFELLQQRISGLPDAIRAPLVYQAFDLLHVDGRSLVRVPLEDRKALLRSVLRDHPRVRFADHVLADGLAFHRAAAERGLEGVIAKHRRSTYEPGRRSPAWLKLKVRAEQEFVVGGWLPGEGNAKDLGALLLGYHDGEGGPLRYAGRAGSGLDDRTRRELRGRLEASERPAPPFDPVPPRAGDLRFARWVAPEMVVRVQFSNWTRDGLVRQPAFKGHDPGRDPNLVTRERAVEPEAAEAEVEARLPKPEAAAASSGGGSGDPPAKGSAGRRSALPASTGTAGVTDDELAALAALGAEGTWRFGSETLKLTNLDKVLFPPKEDARGADDAGPITKRELIRYFARIAPAMLPHLAERPLNLHRYPNGTFGQGFWQKDIPPHAPSWLRIWHETGVDEAREANAHLVADRPATLAWLGNQASFEIHAWTGRLPDPWRPTFAYIDIDPGTKTTWDETLVLARLFRTALGHLGVTGLPKTTGRRGIQIWIPIEPRYSFAETSGWVEQVSRAIGATAPDLVSWEWAKSARGGRARLDFTQNAPIKTLVAPYAVRPSPGAPVSAPIAWDELDDPALRPDGWTIRTIVDRVAARGDLFAEAQTLAQALPRL